MARIIKFEMEVTDEEFANFLSRASGADGRKVTAQTDTDDEGPADAAAPATDKNGVAWDARYHASSKAVNADGTWRRKRGLSDAETAEADAYDKSATVEAPAPTLPTAAPAPAPAAMPGLPTPAPAPTPVTYEEVVALFGQAVAKDASVSANFAELYAKAGVTDPQVLTTDAGAEQRIALAGLLRGIIAG